MNKEKYNSSLQNVYNWGEKYKTPFDRWKDLYPEYLIDGMWNKICIRCNKNTEFKARWCNNCYSEYTKKSDYYRCKAYKLLKNKSLNTNCEITGCNKIMLKYYFETLFDNDMNWDNQSKYWQIDHRIPISWFNIENDEEMKFACNYKNLQPMKKKLNLDKSHNYPKNKLFDYAFHSNDTSSK